MTRTSTLDACYVRVRQKQELGGNFLPPLEANAPGRHCEIARKNFHLLLCFVFVFECVLDGDLHV